MHFINWEMIYNSNNYNRPVLLSEIAPQISKIKSSGNWKSANSSSTAKAKLLGFDNVLLFITSVSAKNKNTKKYMSISILPVCHLLFATVTEQPPIMNQQCMVYHFQCNLCDADYVGFTMYMLARSSTYWRM